MSFGFSASDFIYLTQLAHRTFRNCQKAGEEYVEIACEVRCLHSVLRTLRVEAQKPDSKIFKQDPASTRQLIATTDGCKNVLDSLDVVLVKYEGLTAGGKASAGKKLWTKFRFGSKVEELGVIRGKLVTYTSTIAILIDTMQLQATDRVEGKLDDGFTQMTGQFEMMRKEIYSIASQKRAEEHRGATVSSLSLSTYAGDEKVVWQDFRKELIRKGFQSQSLEKYKHVLQAYMLRLDQSGLLDEDLAKKSGQVDVDPWWAKRLYMETINSLAELHIREDQIAPGNPHEDYAPNEGALQHQASQSDNGSGASDREVRESSKDALIDAQSISSLDSDNDSLDDRQPISSSAGVKVDNQSFIDLDSSMIKLSSTRSEEKLVQRPGSITAAWHQRQALSHTQKMPQIRVHNDDNRDVMHSQSDKGTMAAVSSPRLSTSPHLEGLWNSESCGGLEVTPQRTSAGSEQHSITFPTATFASPPSPQVPPRTHSNRDHQFGGRSTTKDTAEVQSSRRDATAIRTLTKLGIQAASEALEVDAWIRARNNTTRGTPDIEIPQKKANRISMAVKRREDLGPDLVAFLEKEIAYLQQHDEYPMHLSLLQEDVKYIQEHGISYWSDPQQYRVAAALMTLLDSGTETEAESNRANEYYQTLRRSFAPRLPPNFKAFVLPAVTTPSSLESTWQTHFSTGSTKNHEQASDPLPRVKRGIPKQTRFTTAPVELIDEELSDIRDRVITSQERTLKHINDQFPDHIKSTREASREREKARHRIPTNAIWTKINRQLVCPEALDAGYERYELLPTSIIVWRVLSKREIQQYAEATKKIRDERKLEQASQPTNRNPTERHDHNRSRTPIRPTKKLLRPSPSLTSLISRMSTPRTENNSNHKAQEMSVPTPSSSATQESTTPSFDDRWKSTFGMDFVTWTTLMGALNS